MAAGTKKWSAETKSDFITTFFLGWPSKKGFEHKISGKREIHKNSIESLDGVGWGSWPRESAG